MPLPNCYEVRLNPPDWHHSGFGIYVHWPFCEAKCPYCDFNSHVSRGIDHDAWRARMVQDIVWQSARTKGRTVQSIFFGGGTPSLMEPMTVAAIIEEIDKYHVFADDIEITLEANPTSIEADKFLAFRQAGVNRISIGIQALNDHDLKMLGRMHSADEARRAIEIGLNCFDRVSFDLIYARQNQSVSAWEAELNEAIGLAAGHLSLYQLTIEPGTVFGGRYDAGHLKGLPTDALSAELYEITRNICDDAGLPQYEVSNHARPGQESRHNLIYWRYGDYLGIGPGAHGRVTTGNARWATEATVMPNDWITAKPEMATKDIEALSREAQVTEMLLMGLRLREGVSEIRLEAFSDIVPTSRIDDAVNAGNLVRRKGRLYVPNEKNIILNQILIDILG